MATHFAQILLSKFGQGLLMMAVGGAFFLIVTTLAAVQAVDLVLNLVV